MNKQSVRFWLPLVLSVPVSATAGDLLDLSLDDLLKVPITVASRKAVSQRESPGIVTVIEGDAIRRSGARDLVDVLRQVPGYDFRLIVSNILGLGVRGHIGSDGRVLMLVDGIEANEHRFGTAQFGLNFPVENIHRIEIVRGSALAMYGGTAEMGVINIITRSASELRGAEVAASVGVVASGARSREQIAVSAGVEQDQFSLSANAMRGRSLRSDQTFRGLAGASYEMADKDGVEPEYVNVGLAYGDVRLRLQRVDIDVKSRYVGSGIQSDVWNLQHKSETALLSTVWKPMQGTEVTPSVSWQKQSPRETSNPLGVVTSKTGVERTQAKIGVTWSSDDLWHFAGGIDVLDVKYEGTARSFPLRPLAFDRLNVTGLYTEVMRQTEWADFTWGVRRDVHQYAGDLWSQRLAMTRLMGDWHFKLLASAAERAPSVEDYSSSAGGLAVRKNEKVANAELEVGYRIDAGTQLTVNYFDIVTRDTLILRNFSDVHTRGIEASLQIRRDWGNADLSLSTYASGGTDTATVSVINPDTGSVIDSQALVGFSPWKLALSANYKVGAATYLSPTLAWYGPRWGFDVDNSSATVSRLRQYPSAALVNLVVQSEDVGVRGLTLSAGVYNLFAAHAVFAAPIANTTPPVPDMGRELVFRVRYRF